MNTSKMANLAMNDNGFIFDPVTGFSYTANESGLFILRHLLAGLSKEEVLTALNEEYDCVEHHPESDIDHFILMLEAYDLVER